MISQRDPRFSRTWNENGCLALCYAMIAWWYCATTYRPNEVKPWDPEKVEAIAYVNDAVRQRDTFVERPELYVENLVQEFTGERVSCRVTYHEAIEERSEGHGLQPGDTDWYVSEWQHRRHPGHFTAHAYEWEPGETKPRFLAMFDPWPMADAVKDGSVVSFRGVSIR